MPPLEFRPVVVSVLDETKVILLVEDPDDEALTLRAFAESTFGKRIDDPRTQLLPVVVLNEPPPLPVTN